MQLSSSFYELHCYVTNFFYNNQFLAHFEMSQSLPFLVSMSCYINMLSYDNNNKCRKITTLSKQGFFYLQSRYWLSLRALTYLEKLRIFLRISYELHSDVFRYRYISFGEIDPFYRKTLTSSAKNNVQIVCVQLIELTFSYN